MRPSTCSGPKGGRSWRGWPGWAPIFALPLPLGRGGLTISLEGGLEELPEFFFALASFASKSATLAWRSAFSCRKASQAGQCVILDVVMMAASLRERAEQGKTSRKRVQPGWLRATRFPSVFQPPGKAVIRKIPMFGAGAQPARLHPSKNRERLPRRKARCDHTGGARQLLDCRIAYPLTNRRDLRLG